MATYSGTTPFASSISATGLTGGELADEGVSLEDMGYDPAAGTDAGGGTGHGIAISATTHDGLVAPYWGDTWFDRIHLLPRSKIEFGNIVTFTTQTFELYSAYREPTVATLNTITNNLGAGSDIPDISVPSDLDPFTSFLDSSSTRLNPVLPTLEVDAEGAAVFDSTVDFSFSTGDMVALAASGNRISVWSEIWESDFEETLEFKTDVMTALSGKEQRVALRSQPRSLFRTKFRLTEKNRQHVQMLLHGWQSQLWALPMFHNGSKTTAAISINDTSATVDNTDNRDYRVGGYAIVYQDSQVYDVVEVSAVTSTTVTFTNTPVLHAYSKGVQVFPVRLAFIRNLVQGTRQKTKLEDFDVVWQAYDNDTGAPAGSTAGQTTFNSKVLFDACNLMEGDSMQVRHQSDVKFVDNQTGVVESFSRWDRNKRGSTKGFFMANREEILEVRNLLVALGGKQTSFYLPTFIEDFTPQSGITVAAFTLDIDNIEYARFASTPKNGKKYVRLTYNDGTTETNEIVSATKVSDTLERLTMQTAWAASKTVDEIERVEFIELVRFDADRFIFRYRRPGQATLVAPVITVYD